MMPVSFLDIIPKAHTATVTLDTTDGPQEVELTGVSLRALAEISKRYPAFARVLDGGAGSIVDNPEALAAVIAASLGHSGDTKYEAHITGFPSADVIRMALVVVRLTFPQNIADPLPVGAVANGAAGEALAPISPLSLSS